jgi:hypothetical protein
MSPQAPDPLKRELPRRLDLHRALMSTRALPKDAGLLVRY